MALDKGNSSYKKLNKTDKMALMYINLSKHDLVQGCCLCSRCGKPCSSFYYVKDAESGIHCALCVVCTLELNPPKWKLIIATTNKPLNNNIEPIGNYDIWDDTYKRQEHTLTLSELGGCGWFIRKVEETTQIVPKRTVKKSI